MLLQLVTQEGVVVGNRIDTVLIATLVALFIPLLVNLITKQTASDGLRAVVSLIATALTSVIALWINPTDQPITWQLCVNTFVSAFIAAFAAYKGLWKPTGVSGSVTTHTKDFGFSSPPTMETSEKGAEDRGQVDREPGE